ncbi:toprim domain-containing protein [Pedobacter gandavensis]|uniref:toprim domain-containing protein n=1 Tax=Pedobacter gandavensis TaxID=2679963 RepID=UPI002479620D|nr:toprim domain-containing protein [Pedobacter gandavensis]WGQ08968.1 toprim domain-containing protein [Pedobacter gandavensis]
MTAFLNANQIKEQVSLVDLLTRLGHVPAHRSGKEIFYKSMLREEKTASFCVNEQLGVWYDHGGGNGSGIKGGNIIDLGMAYWHPASFREVLDKISTLCNVDSTAPILNDISKFKRPRLPVAETIAVAPNYKIDTTKELGSHPAITRYLQSRGIWELAQGKLKEVYYTVQTNGRSNSYFSAGWQNEVGSWELRNKIGDKEFKACLGKKAISFIPGDEQNLVMFEGYMDYLSWLEDNSKSTASVLVLNSLNLLGAGIVKAKDFQNIGVYFDNDTAGAAGLEKLKQALPHIIDQSAIYEGYNDYNAKLMDKPVKRMPWEEDRVYEKIMSTYRR